MGHCIQYSSVGNFDFFENIVFKVIYSFHMTLFMLISGYLFYYSFKKRNLKELLVHRTQSLVQPIVMCGIVMYLLTSGAKQMIIEHNVLSLFDGAWIACLDGF